ncbi:hypothetical protein GGQ74_001156 [Desulfobaculum xiamenense]|uniref:Uncharacterized protein n=1 Tax=Desulfobaculum xiamenense TaxID=995050 RepID=A0A846QFF3_9BACT|nr:hypothetical protein [Desulfobaculum xiamenense]NJB67516.1 hypothetical protein [Desulfobaculum xiamenense]
MNEERAIATWEEIWLRSEKDREENDIAITVDWVWYGLLACCIGG